MVRLAIKSRSFGTFARTTLKKTHFDKKEPTFTNISRERGIYYSFQPFIISTRKILIKPQLTQCKMHTEIPVHKEPRKLF